MSQPQPKRKEFATGIILNNSNNNSSSNSSNSSSNSNSNSNNLFNRNNAPVRKGASPLHSLVRPSHHIKRNYFQPSNRIYVNVNEMGVNNSVPEAAGGPRRRRLQIHPTRRVRNIPSEGKSRSNYRGHRTKTRKHLGAINQHPTNANIRAQKMQAAKLLADAHNSSNSFNGMVRYVLASGMNKQVQGIVLAKLNSTYKNLQSNSDEEEWDPYA